MKRSAAPLALLAATLCVGAAQAQTPRSGIANIDTVVIIYAENRSFDNLYGSFPGANGLQNVTPENSRQLDRDGTELKELPPVWDGLTAKGVTPAVTQAQTEHMPAKPFAIDDADGLNTKLGVITRDLWHLFYQNQMQIDGGKNDKFVAYADSGGLVMGHYDGSKLPLWPVAQRIRARRQFLSRRVRRLVPQSFRTGLRLHSEISGRRQEPGQKYDRGGRGRRRHAQACRQFAEVGDGRHSEVRQQRADHARLLCRQHHAAAVPAEQQYAAARGRSALRRSFQAEHAAAAA